MVIVITMEEFAIHCVFDLDKGGGEANEICSFCLKSNIRCVIRGFSHTYEEDKDEIVRLPAFHLYYKGNYELTFYPGDCPYATVSAVKDITKKDYHMKRID
jgi:hypothetical protein